MKYINGFDNYISSKRSAVTIGKFDGLHLGHELLISRVEELQKEENLSGIVCAFDMRPLFEKKNIPTDFLLSNGEKADILEKRIDYFIDVPFDEAFSMMEAEDFIRDILASKLQAKYVIVGSDFRFGHNKRGDGRMLKKYSSIYDYQVEIFEKKKYMDKEISSTYIKELLKSGNKELAMQLLGHK